MIWFRDVERTPTRKCYCFIEVACVYPYFLVRIVLPLEKSEARDEWLNLSKDKEFAVGFKKRI